MNCRLRLIHMYYLIFYSLLMERPRSRGDMRVSRQICLLAKFFRGNIDRSYTFCTLGKKWIMRKIIWNYIWIFYQNRLKVEIEVEEPLKYTKIPTYILQPVVENAVSPRNGTFPKPLYCAYHDGTGRGKRCRSMYGIMAWALIQKNFWDFQTGKAQSKRIGLRNVEERIRILYGEGYGLKIDSRQNEFTEVVLTLPVRSENQS